MEHSITLQAAVEMTGRFRNYREIILDPLYQGQAILPLAESFNRYDIDVVLAQPGCTALRVYYGMDADYTVHAILVGVDQNNQNLLPAGGGLTATAEADPILEKGTRCPDICDETSPLVGE